MSLIETTLALSLQAHIGQRDRAGEAYIKHPLRVMHQLHTEEEQATALLHDVLEDSTLTSADLRDAGIPERVIEAVELLTRQEGDRDYSAYLERVKTNPIARAVKLADLNDNLRVTRLQSLKVTDLHRVNKYLHAKRFLEATD